MTEQEYITYGNPDLIRDKTLEIYNKYHKNESIYDNHKYQEQTNITDDIIELLKSAVKYRLLAKTTTAKAKKQTIFIDSDDRVKILTQKSNSTKSNSIIQLSRLKYLINAGDNYNLSKKVITKLLNDNRRHKTIEIDHLDNNKLNNKLNNLLAIPRWINSSGHYDKIKRLLEDGRKHQAKEMMKKLGEYRHLKLWKDMENAGLVKRSTQ